MYRPAFELLLSISIQLISLMLLYSCGTDIPSARLELQACATKCSSWFKNKHSKASAEKSHILIITKNSEIVSIDKIHLLLVPMENYNKLIITDWISKFDNHIKKL